VVTRIAELLADGPTVSVEFFPPKTPEGRAQLERTLHDLAVVEPSFVSVTYGAGGSTREVTRDIVVGINDRWPFPAMPHLTCIGHTRGELRELLDDYVAAGIANVLALAGDPPADGSPAAGDFTYASELVELVRERGDLAVGVAAFPEVHPRSGDRSEDRRHLAAKLDAADFGITQFFYDADDYFRMVDELAALGCSTPVLPGIMPMTNPASIRRFAAMNGAKFPEELATKVDEATTDDERMAVVVDSAVELCERLVAGGVPGLHFYCLNRAEATVGVLEQLGLSRPSS
jgi:methylenetetrahydrofolate reductase (NADPH)